MAYSSISKKDFEQCMQRVAPQTYQESYDNTGWMVQLQDSFNKALLTLDCTEAVVEEAKQLGCDLIVAHHPLLFKGVKRLTGSHYVERSLIAAVRHGISIYACHTNIDNVLHHGVNQEIAGRLELKECKILRPMQGVLYKLVVFVPHSHVDVVEKAMFGAGAGHIGAYDSCSFRTEGQGFFRALDGSSPFVGAKGERHCEAEWRTEVLVEKHLSRTVIQAAMQAHPYEEMAYDLYPLENPHLERGSGLVGRLKEPMDIPDFLHWVKQKLELKVLKYTDPVKSQIEKVALCGGSGSFLLPDAMRQADAFITGDLTYHQFFEALENILLIDAGHFETEQFTPLVFKRVLSENFPNFAALISQVQTNPVNYL